MDAATLAELVTDARTASAAGCGSHLGDPPPFACPGCVADRKAAGDIGWLQRAAALRAMVGCDYRFPRRYRDAVAHHPGIWAWVHAVTERPADPPSLVILGPVGRGKTHQAHGALRAVIAALPGLTWVATRFADFTAGLRPRPDSDPEAEMERHRDAGVLLLDDIGTAKPSEWVEEVTYRLIDHRYNAMLPTIYITNLGVDALRGHLGDRVTSRLAETCQRVVLDGPDLRRNPP